MCSSSSGETSSANRALVPPTSATRRGQLPSFLLGLEVAMKTLLVSSVREVREGAAAIGPRCLLVLTRRPVRKEGCNGQHAGLPSVGCQAPWGTSRLTVGYVPLCGSFILIALLFRTERLALESGVCRGVQRSRTAGPGWLRRGSAWRGRAGLPGLPGLPGAQWMAWRASSGRVQETMVV